MEKGSSMSADRMNGAEAISARAVVIGAELGVSVSNCVWDMGDDLTHEYAHRLDINTAANTVRLYFCDLDLMKPGNESRRERTENRLHRAITQLVPRVPASTYRRT